MRLRRFWSDPFDPLSHQLMRALAMPLVIFPMLLAVAGAGWWFERSPDMIPPWATWVALFVVLVATAPFLLLAGFLSWRFSRAEPPLLGPELPVCPGCGYDCRASPRRCPECGSALEGGAGIL